MFSLGEHEWGNRKTHVQAQPVAGQTDRVVRDSTIEMGGSLPSLFTPVSGAQRSERGMRPHRERQDMIRRVHDSLFTEHLGVSWTVYRLQNLLAGIASRCSVLPGIMYCLSGT